MIFRYPGGKSKKSIQEKILKYFPDKYEEFRDCMVGGGGIFFAVPLDKLRWVNDLNADLISVYMALRDNPKEFISECRKIKPHKKGEPLTSARKGGRALYSSRLKAWFDLLKDDEINNKALKYFFINRTVFAGRVNYEMESRMYFSNPQGWNIVNTNKLEKFAKYVENVKITSEDYTVPLLEDGNNVLIYLDPPYYKNTKLSARSQLYKHNFTEEDHVKLAENIRKCKHKVLISYDDHPFIRNLYCKEDGFNLYCENWTYSGTSLKKKEVGKELVITNYELRI